MTRKIKFVDLNKINKPFKKKFFRSLEKIYKNNAFIKSKYNKLLEKRICKIKLLRDKDSKRYWHKAE